jgi:hypothetical protein
MGIVLRRNFKITCQTKAKSPPRHCEGRSNLCTCKSNSKMLIERMMPMAHTCKRRDCHVVVLAQPCSLLNDVVDILFVRSRSSCYRISEQRTIPISTFGVQHSLFDIPKSVRLFAKRGLPNKRTFSVPKRNTRIAALKH